MLGLKVYIDFSHILYHLLFTFYSLNFIFLKLFVYNYFIADYSKRTHA